MKTILFPYKIDQDNTIAYAKAMDMAQQMGAKVIFFTCLSDLSPATKDEAYFHLLALNGAYQTNYNHWQATKVKSERVFATGNFDRSLKDLLESTFIDWIVPTSAIRNGASADYLQSPSLTLVKQPAIYYPNLSADNR